MRKMLGFFVINLARVHAGFNNAFYRVNAKFQ